MQGVQRVRGSWLVTGAAVLALLLVPCFAEAQLDTGNIAGVVTDETAGALPGVSITARNTATGQLRTATTNAEGRYQVAGIPPGQYSVTAELSGFGNLVRQGITVNVGSTVDVNLQMKISSVAENVTVTGDAPLVESTKTSLSTVVTGQAIEALPTRNRDYLGLTLLMPATGEATVNGENGSGFAVGGAKGHEAALLVDGLPGYLTIGLCALPSRCRVSSIGRRDIGARVSSPASTFPPRHKTSQTARDAIETR